MTAPTYVGDQQTAFDSTTSPKTLSVTATSGDLVAAVGLAATADGITVSTPTGGPTWATPEALNTDQWCESRLFTTTATGDWTHSQALVGTVMFGAAIWQWRDSAGFDDSASAAQASGTAPSVDVVTTTDDCGLVVAVGDWNAADGTSRTWRTINGSAITEDLYFRDAAQYTVYLGHHPNVGTAGTKAAGLSAPTMKPATVAGAVKGVPAGPYVVANNGAALTASRSPSVTFTGYTPVENDVVVLFPSSTTTAHTMTEPSGWVNPLGAGVDVESDAHQIACAYHIVTAGEAGGSNTFTATNWYGATTTGFTQGCVIRGVDPADVVDIANSTFASGNTVTPHVLAGVNPVTDADGLIVSSVAKDATGTYTNPAAWTQIRQDNTNNGRWLGHRTALSTASENVAATNITPSAGDEYTSVTVVFRKAPVAAGDQPPVQQVFVVPAVAVHRSHSW